VWLCWVAGCFDLFLLVGLSGWVFRGGAHTVDKSGQMWSSVDNGGQTWINVVKCGSPPKSVVTAGADGDLPSTIRPVATQRSPKGASGRNKLK